MEGLELALYQIEEKNFFEAENILRGIIKDDSKDISAKLLAYEILIETKININEEINTFVLEFVNLFTSNNKTNQALSYLKKLYSITQKIYILDLSDEIAFKFGQIGELKEIKLKKCKYFYKYKCSVRLNEELLICSKLFKNEISFKEFQILNSMLVYDKKQFRLLIRTFVKEYLLKTSLTKNDSIKQILNTIITKAKETFFLDEELLLELYLIEVESELVSLDTSKIIKTIIKLLLAEPTDNFNVQISIMCLERVSSKSKVNLLEYLKTLKEFNYQSELKSNTRLKSVVSQINKEEEKNAPYFAEPTRIKVKFISEDSLLLHTEFGSDQYKPIDKTLIMKDLFEKIGSYEDLQDTQNIQFELIQKIKNENILIEDNEVRSVAYDLIVLFLEMEFFEVVKYVLDNYDGGEKEYLQIEFYLRSKEYFSAVDLVDNILQNGNVTSDEVILYKYLKGEALYSLKKYKSALKEFQYIKQIEPNYRLVKERIDEIKKNK